jgi:preprotein translocase subunit SecA
VLGRRPLTEIYRQLLLAVITELWVDYLTQMEGLRTAIGLEAYAQRDPLVQYKSRASELFQNLLRDMRTGVIARMFTYRPRDLSSVQTDVRRLDGRRPADSEAGPGESAEAALPDESALNGDDHAPFGGDRAPLGGDRAPAEDDRAVTIR